MFDRHSCAAADHGAISGAAAGEVAARLLVQLNAEVDPFGRLRGFEWNARPNGGRLDNRIGLIHRMCRRVDVALGPAEIHDAPQSRYA